MTTITREDALAEREALATESALTYRLQRFLPGISALLGGGNYAREMRQIDKYLRDREVATREASDAISELLGMDRLRK